MSKKAMGIRGLTVVMALSLAGCASEKETEAAAQCDPFATHPEGDFEFSPQVDESLPESWRTEFALILATLQEIASISPCIHNLEEDPANSPMKIYAWSSDVASPFEDERPGMQGASISGDGTDSWMILEINADEFKYDSLHRYSVVAHEYWHVYQKAAWKGQGLDYPAWMWEGGAKVFEELYIAEHYGRSEFDGNLHPVIATAIANPSDFELYASEGGAVGGDSDINYNTSAFILLALARELRERQGLTETESLGLVLTAPATQGSDKPFQDVFGLSLEEFYVSLAQYPAVSSVEDWFEGDVIDASPVIPSTSLSLDEILQSAR